MKVIVIGLGEIGQPLLKIIKDSGHQVQGIDINTDLDTNWFVSPDFMHICFPYSDEFIPQVLSYIDRFKPEMTIIESTVMPFTTCRIYHNAKMPICHSPVRGREADGFDKCFFIYTKFLGCPSNAPVQSRIIWSIRASRYYRGLGFKTQICHTSDETEFMKILNTTYFGLMISWFQEVHRICKKFDLDEHEIHEFFSTNESDSCGKYPRPIFIPDVIEGHCVIPNAELLNQVYPSDFVKTLIESNNKMKDEKSK